jgi:adenylate cyclase
VILLALSSGFATARLPTRSVALAGLFPPLGWFAAARIAFGQGWWVPVAVPLAALVTAAAVSLLFRYWVSDRERRRIKSTFSRYMPPKLVEFLAAHPDRVKLGGETRHVTIMFCDVRDFTTISEGFADDPQGLVRLVNRFLTRMANIIHEHEGTIDKYIGDCIMAYWNAPLDDARHADLACDAALAMRRALISLNAELAAEAHDEGRTFHALHAGIGVNTGDCVLGNLGSAQSVQSFSALGDPVNLASRLEGQSKVYGVDIVVGEATRAAAPDWAALELDLIAVKGKRQSVRIFALLGDRHRAVSPEFRALVEQHGAMLAAYRAQDWPATSAALEAAAGLAPELATLYALFRRRVEAYAAHPPGPDWDGVFVATSK